VHDGTRGQVERLLGAGVEVLMLPCFRSAREVAEFMDIVAGRADVVLLLETREAAQDLAAILAVPGIDEVHIGINDFALSLGLPNRFAVLLDPVVLNACAHVRAVGARLGVGGIGRAGDASLAVPADLVYAEIVRLGGEATLISRSFLGAGPLAPEVTRARAAFARWAAAPAAEIADAHRLFRAAVAALAGW
jgi:HpcH/HpaI aldolase/citrate lyase family